MGDHIKERGNSYPVYPPVDDLGCNRFTSAPLLYIVRREGSQLSYSPKGEDIKT